MTDFNDVPCRRSTESVKWDLYGDTVLPMWVADMDFKASPAIISALQRRLDHGVFGYELLPDKYFTAVSEWFSSRHGWDGIRKENIIPTTGVIAAYSACMKAMTSPGDKVIVQTPCYNAFFPAIGHNRCIEVHNPLLRNPDGTWSMDFEDLEKKASDPLAKVFLLCNPHNPVGRVWTREELLRAGEICLRHGVFVISDEIHCELTYPGHDYTPFATLPIEMVLNSATCCSPTKAFNIAGIQIANVVATEPSVTARIDRALSENQCSDINVFGATALVAAYTRGAEWLDDLRNYLAGNRDTVMDFLASDLPGVSCPPLEGTYLMWLDCSSFRKEGEPIEGFSDRLAAHLRANGLALSSGTLYGSDGEGFERLNIACPRSRLVEGLRLLKAGLESYPGPSGKV